MVRPAAGPTIGLGTNFLGDPPSYLDFAFLCVYVTDPWNKSAQISVFFYTCLPAEVA